MIRQNIILGDYTYIVELYRAGEDLENPKSKYFYFLRKNNLISDIFEDTDIYFIDKEEDIIIYPINGKLINGYSTKYSDFNSDYNEENIEYLKNNFYQYKDNELQEVSLICDLVRIYFPVINPNVKFILDVENYINSIRFHYLIKNIETNKININSFTEYTYNHNRYSEYVDIYIPSLKNLIVNDDLLIKEFNNTNKNITIDNYNYISFNNLYLPFKIDKNINEKFIKKIYDNTDVIKNSFYNTLNINFYPYESINNDGILISNDIERNSNIFVDNFNLKLSAELRFPRLDDFEIEEEFKSLEGNMSLIGKFDYNKIIKDSSLQDNYLYLNNLTLDNYINAEFKDKLDEEDLDDPNVFLNKCEEYDIEDTIYKTGFFIEIASDKFFKHIIYKYSISINIEETNKVIDDIIFPISNIFNSYRNYPELLVLRIRYIDKLSSTIITSNPVIIDKEIYKYLINDDEIKRIHFNEVYYNNRNGELVKYDKNDNQNNMINLDNQLNFIDRINASIIKENETTNNIINKSYGAKVIYKPIFYRSTDLQNVNIISDLNQNIGVNLSEYMSKVNTFKLKIENNTYIEIGRNDVYVIFNISSNDITNKTGRYFISNENDELISYGNYTIE